MTFAEKGNMSEQKMDKPEETKFQPPQPNTGYPHRQQPQYPPSPEMYYPPQQSFPNAQPTPQKAPQLPIQKP